MVAGSDWRKDVAALGGAAALLAAGCVTTGCGGGNTNAAHGGNEPENPVTERGWELVWADEFSGNALDAAKWNIQTGDGTAEGIPGWGNNELQSYQSANVAVSGGHLVITAREESADGRGYTSGRINTSGKMDARYGRMEARIRAPGGRGLWSAFWMLPTNSPYGGWAAGGEIDIMEVYSRDPSPFSLAVVHYGMAWPLNVYTGGRYTAFDPADGFHVYALEWDEDELRWFIDGTHFQTARNSTYWTYYRDAETGAHTEGAAAAPFDQPFHLLLNLAVGGNLPGPPVPESFPSDLLVDYVRVYRCNIPTPGVDCAGFADLVDPGVEALAPSNVYRAEYPLYGDALGPLVFLDVEETLDLAFGVYDNNGALALSEVDSGEGRGMVVDVQTSGGGNFSIHAADASRQQFFGMGSASHPGNYAGELQFDLFVFGAETDAESGLQVKIDSGFPDLGFVELAVADLPKDEWTTVTVQVSDIAHNPGQFGGGPLNLDRVLSLFVFEPTGAAHVRLDNIKLLCGHPLEHGCGITPPAPPRVNLMPQAVFVDAVDPLWDNGIRGSDSGSGWVDYTDNADPSNKSQWEIIAAADPARGRIIDVTFAGGSEFGVWFIQAASGVDLSGYATGEVRFDIKVDDYGENDAGMTMKIDCVFPCTSGDQAIGKVGDGAWETVRIPVSQLLSGGLDASNVNTGIVVFPTRQHVAQNFQLDNILWHPGEPEGGSGLVLYQDGLTPAWFLWDCCGGATFSEVEDAERGTVVELRFGPGGTVTGFQAVEGVDTSGLANATLRFDFKEVAPPPEGSVWRVKLESSNAATAVEVLMTAAGNPSPGPDWQSYSFDLAMDFDGLDRSDLKLVLFFPDWQGADGAVGRFDNVRVEAAP